MDLQFQKLANGFQKYLHTPALSISLQKIVCNLVVNWPRFRKFLCSTEAGEPGKWGDIRPQNRRIAWPE